MGRGVFEGGGEDRAAGAEVLEFVPFGGVGGAGSASGAVRSVVGGGWLLGLCCCWERGFGDEDGWGGGQRVRAKAALGAKVVHVGGFWRVRWAGWSGYESASGGDRW